MTSNCNSRSRPTDHANKPNVSGSGSTDEYGRSVVSSTERITTDIPDPSDEFFTMTEVGRLSTGFTLASGIRRNATSVSLNLTQVRAT